MADRETMQEAVLRSLFPGNLGIFLDHVERTSAEGLEGEQQAAAVWMEVRPSHRQLAACEVVVDAADWRRMTKDVKPCSAALIIMTMFLSKVEKFLKEVDALEDEILIEKYAEIQTRQEIKRNELGAIADKFAFFHEPRCALDRTHWYSLRRWSIDEAAAIHFNKDPRLVNINTLSPLMSIRRSPFKRSYAELVEHLKRALGEQDPTKQIDRAKFTKIPGFSVSIDEAHPIEDDDISTPSRHSMYKIILFMTIKHYNLELRASTSQDIRFNKKAALGDIENIGMTLSGKSFMKYLKEAVEYGKQKELFKKSS